MNINPSRAQAIEHSVSYWMHQTRKDQIELEMLQDWYRKAARLHPPGCEHLVELSERINALMQWKADGNKEMQRQRDKITPHLQPWVVEGAEYQGDGHWADYPPLEFCNEEEAREYESLVNACMQTGGQIKIRRVYQKVLTC